MREAPRYTLVTRQCVLPRLHLGDCDVNEFDPVALERCRKRMVQRSDGSWVRLLREVPSA